MELQDVICGMTYKIAAFEENYLENRDEDTGFEEIVSVLGEPLAEEELDMIANCVLEILEKRCEVLNQAIEIGTTFEK